MHDDDNRTRILPRSRVTPGTTLNGIYEIDELIAVGGMGEIYKGHAIQTGDAVAIKMIRPDFAENESALALFRKEASALHDVFHEAIIRYYVFSVDPVVGQPYLAMEYVDGPSLSAMLKSGGPLPFESADGLRQRLASGLHSAHELGIIHRDMSPDNVILPGGNVKRAKIIDFGIARTSRVGEGTVIGSGFAGKFSYVSPEQLGLFGGEVGPKSDMYSLGLVLAEALLGKPIDMGGSQVQVIEKRRVVPDLTGIDPRIRPLLHDMLQPRPEDRPESLAAVAAWTVRTRRPGGARRLALAAAGLAGLGVLGAGAFAGWPAIEGAIHGLTHAGRAETARAPADEPPALAAAGQGGAGSPGQSGDRQPGSDQAGWTAETALGAVPPVLQPPAPLLTPAPPPVPEPVLQASPQLSPPPALASPAAPEPPPMQQAAIPPVAIPAVPPPANKLEAVTRFITDYDGGDCFFVQPTRVSEGSAAVEAYGASPRPFMAFDQDFIKANGFEAQIALRQVTGEQCALVSFMAKVAGDRALSPRLEIASFNIRSGQFLEGSVRRQGDRHMELLLVSDDGLVHSLQPFSKRAGAEITYRIKIEGNGVKGSKPQVVLALSSSRPLAALSGGKALPADKLFPRLVTEAADTGQSLGVAAKYFKLEE